MRVPFGFLVALLAMLLLSCGDDEGLPVGSDSATRLPTSPMQTAAPTPTATAIMSLPPAAGGFVWQQVPPTPEYGLPGYAVQTPLGWTTPQLWANPVPFMAPDSSRDRILQLITRATPNNLGWEHPTLLDLPMSGTTCGEGKPIGRSPGNVPLVTDPPPAEVITSDTYTWNVYYFLCGTRITAADALAGKESVPFEVRAAEARSGDVVLSVMAFEPPDSALAEAAFAQALQSFTRQ